MVMFLIIHVRLKAKWQKIAQRTVYGNGNAFSQLISVCTHERRDCPELVELQIFGAKGTLPSVCIDNLEIKLVYLGHS